MKYLCDPHIIPAVVPRDAADIETRAEVSSKFAQWLHVDICDGDFTPDNNWPLPGLSKLPADTLAYEAHIMASAPEPIGLAMLESGAQRLIVHREVFADLAEAERVCTSWRAAGAREIGCALLLDTPLSELDGMAHFVDFVQLMSIPRVGHQGEQFDEHVLSRVEELHAAYPEMMVSVDGGISEANVEELVRAGANRLVVGHVLLESTEPEATYASIHERAMRGCKPTTLELSV